MAHFSEMSIGKYVAGEKCLQFTPRHNDPKPGILFVHGAGSDADYNLDTYGRHAVRTMRIVDEYPALSADFGGKQTWGNAAATNAIGQYLNVFNNRPDVVTNEYALIADSMGGINALNYAAGALVKPKAIVLVIPVLNPEDIRANNRTGYASLVNAAYGGTYNESTQGSTRNPHTMRAMAKLKNIPTLIFYGLTDTTCLPQFATDYIAADPNYRKGVPIAGGHAESTYAAVDHDVMMKFFKDNLG